MIHQAQCLRLWFDRPIKVYYILKGSCVHIIITPNGEEKAIVFHTEDFMPIIGNVYVRSENSDVTYLLKANEGTEALEVDLSNRESVFNDRIYIQFVSQNALRFF